MGGLAEDLARLSGITDIDDLRASADADRQEASRQEALAARAAAGDPLVTWLEFEDELGKRKLYAEQTQAQHDINKAYCEGYRDLEVTVKVRVRVRGDDAASPKVVETLLALVEHQEFLENGELFCSDGQYAQVSYSNDYRLNGVNATSSLVDHAMREAYR